MAGLRPRPRFPPLTTLTFATLPARLRTEGAAINALLRNLARRSALPCWCRCCNSQENRAEFLVSQFTPFSAGWPFGKKDARCGFTMLAVWDAEINRQAAMIGYLNDFRAMTICVLVTILLLFFMRKQMLMR